MPRLALDDGHPVGRVEPPAQLDGRDHAPDPAPEDHHRTTGRQNVITVSAFIFEVASSAIDARCAPRAFPGGWRESSWAPLRNA